jgi:small-conductance mechanosensitive channel
VLSDLRVAIFKALGEAGIEIPFNQVDVNLRDLEAIKGYLGALTEQKPNGSSRRPAHAAARASSSKEAGVAREE